MVGEIYADALRIFGGIVGKNDFAPVHAMYSKVEAQFAQLQDISFEGENVTQEQIQQEMRSKAFRFLCECHEELATLPYESDMVITLLVEGQIKGKTKEDFVVFLQQRFPFIEMEMFFFEEYLHEQSQLIWEEAQSAEEWDGEINFGCFDETPSSLSDSWV